MATASLATAEEKEAYYNEKMKESVYRRYKDEAYTNNLLFENIYNVALGTSKANYEAMSYDDKKAAYENLASCEPQPPANVKDWAISVEKIDEMCGKYIEIVNKIDKIEQDFQDVGVNFNSKNIVVNNYTFDKKIKEIEERMEQVTKRMAEFIHAVSERAKLVNKVQYWHVIDYARYYRDYASNLERQKTWVRSSSQGWSCPSGCEIRRAYKVD